ncbi:hypothetical protein J3T99_05730 [Acetobacteraceae bacterium B3987]|nr:hypothetical protein [Acetobacteraceae bacterium B3987]
MAFLKQTDPVAGQPVTVTIPYLDQTGTLQFGQIKVPPGKDATLPDNLLTTDAIQNYVLGNLGQGANDQQAVGVHWNGENDTPEMVYGNLKDQKYSNLLGSNQNGLYLTNFGNVVPEIQAGKRQMIQRFTATNVKDGDIITFPQAFTDDNVSLMVFPKLPNANGNWDFPICGYGGVSRYNFGCSRAYLGSTPKTEPGDISVIAIGGIG